MAPSVEALITGSVLKWARVSAGYSVDAAADKLEIEQTRLIDWEEERSRPTVSKLNEIGRIYKRPTAVFYLSEPPRKFQALHDFRRLPGTIPRETPALNFAIRGAEHIHENAIELLEILGEAPVNVPRLESPSLSDPEHFGNRARGILDVNLDDQATWDEYTALHSWIAAVERTGIIVSQAGDVPLSEMRGFSSPHEIFPVILVNRKDSPKGRIFSLLHEFAHILLRHGGLCNLQQGGSEADEVFCNAAAAAILAPQDAFLSEPDIADVANPLSSWDFQSIRRLTRKYTASEEMILRRLQTFGKITKAYYQERSAELHAIPQKKSGGPVPQAKLRLSEFGPTYVGMALQAYDSDSITTNDLADFLRLKTSQFADIREEMRGRVL